MLLITARKPYVPDSAAVVLTFRFPPFVTLDVHAERFPDSKSSANIKSDGVAVGVGVAVGAWVGVGVKVGTGVFVGGMGVAVGGIGVFVGVGVGIGVLVAVGNGVGVLVAVGVGVDALSAIVNRRSSHIWSVVLERRIRVVAGFVQPVTSVAALYRDVVVLTFGLPALLNVNTLPPIEPTLTLRTITGLGKVIVPCDPPFAI